MGQIRCLIAGVPQVVLADIVHRVAEHELDVEFVKRIEVEEIDKLSSHVREHAVDVVMTGFNSTELPKVCNDLLEDFNDVVVVGLVADGRRLCVFVDDAGPTELTELMRVAVQGKRKRR